MIRVRLRFTRQGWFRVEHVHHGVYRRTILLGPWSTAFDAKFQTGLNDAV